jgi:hypothetical protein
MSDDPLAEVIVAEAHAPHVLPFPTEAKVEYLPVVIPQPKLETEPAVVEDEIIPAPSDLADGNPDDMRVPVYAEQRLIYHWLKNGPMWAASIVAPGPPLDEPVVTPFPYFRSDLPEAPRRHVDFGDDGLSRVILFRP